jgi:(2R)-3-sulfolactate dehydrogenase (NADP+)
MPEILSLSAATELVERALIASNVSQTNARSVARALIAAEADGQSGHGLSRLPSYAGQARIGKVNGHAEPKLKDIKPGIFRVDGGHGYAFPAFDIALPEVAERAARQGIAAAAVYRSHHFGVAGHHCEWLAERGCIAFVYGNSPKALALWGGKKPVLGTNPIAFAAPAGDVPLVIDMAVSTVARGKVLAAREKGETSIPGDWALGPDGQPTTDPSEALKGTMQPMGGAKGAALALMVEVMSACLAGAALGAEASSLIDMEGGPPNLGQTIVALDANALSAGMFEERFAALRALYDETEGARLPGLRRLSARRAAAKKGLSVNDTLLRQIREIAA